MFIVIFLSNKNMMVSISYAVFCMAISFVANLITVMANYFILNNVDIQLDNNFQRIFIYIVYTIIAYSISKVIGGLITHKDLNIFGQLSKRYIAYIFFGGTVAVVFFYFQIFALPTFDDPAVGSVISSVISVLYLMFLLIAVYVFIMGVKKDIESKHSKALLANLSTYIKGLEATYLEMRKFRHDYRNVLLAVYAYIDNDDIASLKEYFNEKLIPIADNMEAYNSTLDRLSNIGLLDLKGLTAMKLMQAQERGIFVHIEAPDKIDEIDFDTVNLIRMAGILLDNAVEAAAESQDKTIEFAIYKNNDVVTIIITNSYKGPLPDTGQMRKAGFSTKGENRGIGLYTVDKMIHENKNIMLLSYTDKGKFVQELKISKKLL